MDKEFVPNAEALELKQLGFDEDSFRYYNNDFKLSRLGLFYIYDNPLDFLCLAPTFSQAFRWFRKNHDLVHRIDRDGGWWLCSILDIYDEEEQGAIEIHIDNCYPDSYEEAELACLKKIIEIVKNR